MTVQKRWLCPHAGGAGIPQAIRNQRRASSDADDFDLKVAGGLGEFSWHVSHGDGTIGVMGVAARRDPSNDLAVMPDGLVANDIVLVRIDGPGQ